MMMNDIRELNTEEINEVSGGGLLDSVPIVGDAVDGVLDGWGRTIDEVGNWSPVLKPVTEPVSDLVDLVKQVV
ncbi:hypothetical protein [Serratia sp. 1D1416]|uniref:hypothetical protein n=1 Tax=Serratia sp. 1D1416 TaxID=2447890 RepID=UPI001013CA60|nr:hypothetical protein [Serratia sp. 1D1416]